MPTYRKETGIEFRLVVAYWVVRQKNGPKISSQSRDPFPASGLQDEQHSRRLGCINGNERIEPLRPATTLIIPRGCKKITFGDGNYQTCWCPSARGALRPPTRDNEIPFCHRSTTRWRPRQRVPIRSSFWLAVGYQARREA